MDLLEYANGKLEEAIQNGEMDDAAYWRGYRDCASRVSMTPQSAVNILRSANLAGVLRPAADMGAEALERETTPPPNDPLTVDELREMDGEAVWFCRLDGSNSARALVHVEIDAVSAPGFGVVLFENCGKTWLAYRRKPEEGTV